MHAEEKIHSVSDINRIVKELLEQSFYPFWIVGEVSNLTIHRSGHVYFTLKDERSQLSAVFFRGAAAAREMQLAAGMQVEAYGRLTVYEPRGAYQVVVNRLRGRGKGDLQRRFDELKQKLREEGLFDANRKRPVPALPRCIGVVTSPQGAALRDFLQIIGRRFANVRIRIYPAAVQGDAAAGQIAQGIRFFNQTRSCDVIVVTRGGGSMEDLWPFNEEVVARAIAASELPLISAVGHEVDYTMSDFVADLRVPTPSAAAELVIGRHGELLEKIAALRNRLNGTLNLKLSELRRRVQRCTGSYVFREPSNLVRTCQQRVDELTTRLGYALRRQMEAYRGKLERCDAQLRMLDPQRVLERGYSILIAPETGAVLTDAQGTVAGAELRGILARGELRLCVSSVTPQRTGNARSQHEHERGQNEQ